LILWSTATVEPSDAASDARGTALVKQLVSAIPAKAVGRFRVEPQAGWILAGHVDGLSRRSGSPCSRGPVRQLDVRPPFDLAREHQRKHGYSPKLGEAIEVFTANLPKAVPIRIKELRRSAALLAVLDPRPAPERARPWWIDGVRASLSELDGDERREWDHLVLTMSVSERMQMPKNWERHARSTVEALGEGLVLRRLADWWPDPDRTDELSFEGSGAQLLKHFIWMLDLLPREPGEDLACRLASVDWPVRNPPRAILKPATAYLCASTSPEARAAYGTLALALA
jgi:hypothetical protein